jgi:hypothetical protein
MFVCVCVCVRAPGYENVRDRRTVYFLELRPYLSYVRHFRCACGMHIEGNSTVNSQLYCIDRDSSYMFRQYIERPTSGC